MAIELVSATKNLLTLKSFVMGGCVGLILNTLGDVELKAAKLALQNARESRTQEAQKREFTLAVGHLQSALMAFDRMRTASASSVLDPGSLGVADEKHSLVAALLTVCYLFLNDKQMAIKNLNILKGRGEAVESWWEIPTYGLALFHIINPVQWYRLAQSGQGLTLEERRCFIRNCNDLLGLPRDDGAPPEGGDGAPHLDNPAQFF